MTDRYVLITAARNEQDYIEPTIQSVVQQTVFPVRWVIVSDGSTDATDDIVKKYAAEHDFIVLMRRESTGQRVFSAQARAVNAAYETLRDLDFDFIGNLDADITFDPEYYETALDEFDKNPRLGIAGGAILERVRGEFEPRPGNRERCVAGAIQLFRRACFEKVGGYHPLQYGGYDSVAQEMARMKGYEVRSFPHLGVYHHRPTGSVGAGVLRARAREGAQDYCIGNHPVYELAKAIHRIFEAPYCIGSLARLWGYTRLWITGTKVDLPPEFLRYFRRSQVSMLKKPFGPVQRAVGEKNER